MSINSFTAGCNQRSSRHSLMILTDEDVRTGLDALQAIGLVVPSRQNARVRKFEHRIRTVLNLRRDEKLYSAFSCSEVSRHVASYVLVLSACCLSGA